MAVMSHSGSGRPGEAVSMTIHTQMIEREDLSRNFGFILHDVARLMRTAYDRRMKALGLTRSQWWVLTHLYRNDGVTQSELADILEIEKPTLGRLLDRLASNGWIRREEHAQDRRAKRVCLTEEVKPAMKAMREAAAELRRDALAGLTPEQQTQFVDTLIAVKANLGGSENGVARAGASVSVSARNVSGTDKSGTFGAGVLKDSAANTATVPNAMARNAGRGKGRAS
jgi:DNA-binding MarR family transcriptional regulator